MILPAGHSVLNVAAFPYNRPIPFQTTLPDQTAASAQAATGVAPSTTEQPAVDELVFGDGVIDGMCATPSDSDDDAEECEHGTDVEATDVESSSSS